MKLENQVCSLDLAKRLKELGVKQNGLYHWITYKKIKPSLCFGTPVTDRDFSAFTVAELGEMLPETELIRDTKVLGQWGCDFMSHRTFGDTEADTRAKMLVYLLENKLITL